jgi:hypothetical protein
VEGLEKQWQDSQTRVEDLAYNSVPGAMWTRLLRMAHEGTPAQQKEARDLVRSYFNVDLDSKYTAQIWFQHNLPEAIEFDFFSAATNSASEVKVRLDSNVYQAKLTNQNYIPPATMVQKKAALKKEIQALIDQIGRNRLLTVGKPWPTANPNDSPEYENAIATVPYSEIANCINTLPTKHPYPWTAAEVTAWNDECYKRHVTNFFDTFYERATSLITNYIDPEVRQPPGQSASFPWSPAMPFLFVVLREDQLAKLKSNPGAKLEVTVAATKDGDSNGTFGNRGRYTFTVYEFEKFQTFDHPREPGKKLVAAVHNATDFPLTAAGAKDILQKLDSKDGKPN